LVPESHLKRRPARFAGVGRPIEGEIEISPESGMVNRRIYSA
jgi:hypothetical protein